MLVRVAILVVIAGGAAAVYFSPLRGLLTIENARSAAAGLREVWYGPLVFIAAFAAGCVLLVPATVFVVAAALIWGWILGGVYALTGGTLGAVASFVIARFIGAGVLSRFGNRGTAAARALEKSGFRALLMVRLVPVFPFAVINFGAGVANVRLMDFFFATLVGAAPSMFVVAYSADAIAGGTLSSADLLRRIAIPVLLIAALVLIPPMLKKRFAGSSGSVD